MNSEAITRKYYSKLKSLPDMKILSTVASIESALVVLRSIEIGFIYFISFLIYVITTSIILITEKKLILFFTDLTAFFYLILDFIIPSYYYFSLSFFSPLLGYALLPKYNELKVSVIIFFENLIPLIPFFNIYIFIYAGLISLIFYTYLYTINVRGERITGVKSMQIVRPFLLNITKKRKESLEKFLEDISVKTVINAGIFKFDEINLVVPKIHYGISGDIGSSKFIYQLEDENPHNIVFHGPGSHEIDIASSTQSLKVAKRIAEEELNPNNWTDLEFYGIKEWTSGQFHGITLDFNTKSLSFIQRPKYGIDDLPLKLWDFTVHTGNYIVDCHNEYLSEDLPTNSYKCITDGITKALSGEKTPKPLIFGYEEDNVKCEGLCNSKIKVLYISDGEKDMSVIYIYSNNADPSLTEKVRDKLKEIVTYPILVTPDDHSCTGTVLGDLYEPAQSCDEIVSKAYELTLRAKKKAKNVKASFKKVDVKGVKVIGSFISLMVKALEEVGSYALRTFWIPLISPLVLMILLILFIHASVKF